MTTSESQLSELLVYKKYRGVETSTVVTPIENPNALITPEHFGTKRIIQRVNDSLTGHTQVINESVSDPETDELTTHLIEIQHIFDEEATDEGATDKDLRTFKERIKNCNSLSECDALLRHGGGKNQQESSELVELLYKDLKKLIGSIGEPAYFTSPVLVDLGILEKFRPVLDQLSSHLHDLRTQKLNSSQVSNIINSCASLTLGYEVHAENKLNRVIQYVSKEFTRVDTLISLGMSLPDAWLNSTFLVKILVGIFHSIQSDWSQTEKNGAREVLLREARIYPDELSHLFDKMLFQLKHDGASGNPRTKVPENSQIRQPVREYQVESTDSGSKAIPDLETKSEITDDKNQINKTTFVRDYLQLGSLKRPVVAYEMITSNDPKIIQLRQYLERHESPLWNDIQREGSIYNGLPRLVKTLNQRIHRPKKFISQSL